MFSLAFLMIRDEFDREFVGDLYKKFEQPMYKIAYNILLNSTDAEDAVQNTFMNIIDNLEKIRSIKSCETKYYLAALVRNAAIDLQRKANRLPESIAMEELDGIKADLSVESNVLTKLDCETIKLKLRSLPKNEFDILFMNLILGYQPSEIAQKYGIAPNTVRQRLYRAKQHFRQELEKEEINQ